MDYRKGLPDGVQEVMEEALGIIMFGFLCAVIGVLLYAGLTNPTQVEAGYGYKWKCSGHQVAKVQDVYYDVKPCERVKK